jgi:6-phosphogluconolactonase (cycloisomerase 2 family)
MKNSYIRGLMLSPVLVILFMIDVHAQNFVYTDNDSGVNSVTAFSVAPNGALTNIGTFATGGSGGAGGFFASNRARTCTVGNRLYVANDNSNNVSGFDINPFTGSLSLVPGSPFATGGIGAGLGISLDCVPNGNFLIAANGGSNNITVFSITTNGALIPVAGSPFAAGGSGPDGVKVAPNGQFLSVALESSDEIGMFSIAANGALTPVPGSPFASPATGNVAGVEINCASTFLYAPQANSGSTDVDVFSIGANGALTLVQTSNNPGVGDNSNAGVLSPNDQFLFVSNQFSNSVTVFNVAANGTLSLLAGSPFGGANAVPCGIATNAAGTFLFTANVSSSTVTSFSIAGNGALTLVGNFAAGQLDDSEIFSLAVFPAKSCSACQLTCPANITVSNDPSQCGAVVTYPAPTTSGACGTIVCSPASSSFFPVGTTTVKCKSNNNAGPEMCTFTVTVNDTESPVIMCPGNVNGAAAASCPIATGAPVSFTVTATDNCGTPALVCSPPSGSTFPVGTTTVTCTATDASGNASQCSFTVSAFSFCLQDESNPGNVVLVNAQTGDFSFCCGGVPIASGRGTLTTRGCIGSIDASKGDRRVHIQWDTSAVNGAGAGTAYVQKLSDKVVCQITDKNMSNNTCQCSSPPPPVSPKKPPKERTF